ncbi:uncharacterized protein G2W53_038015 [Senna tora]|uniref:Uncharacterized protein n=1 Tax=Senna tora TaxID=362788 RepID=A0A834SL40_9FABA|nr:uncharacterized protein G2W53_038015 [Senna tora]
MKNVSKNKLFLCFRPVHVMLDSTVAHNKISHNSMPPKRRFSRLIKAMLFETILNRRSRRNNRYRRDSCGSDSSYSTSTSTEETSSTCDDKSIWTQTSLSLDIQEIIPQSHFSSSQQSKSYPKHTNTSPPHPLKKMDYSAIYFFLLILTLTVLWGKILGIIFTSICLYSYSIWNARNQKTDSKLHRHRLRAHKGSKATIN